MPGEELRLYECCGGVLAQGDVLVRLAYAATLDAAEQLRIFAVVSETFPPPLPAVKIGLFLVASAAFCKEEQ